MLRIPNAHKKHVGTKLIILRSLCAKNSKQLPREIKDARLYRDST